MPAGYYIAAGTCTAVDFNSGNQFQVGTAKLTGGGKTYTSTASTAPYPDSVVLGPGGGPAGETFGNVGFGNLSVNGGVTLHHPGQIVEHCTITGAQSRVGDLHLTAMKVAKLHPAVASSGYPIGS